VKYASVGCVEVCEVLSEWAADAGEYSVCGTAQGLMVLWDVLFCRAGRCTRDTAGGSAPTVAERRAVCLVYSHIAHALAQQLRRHDFSLLPPPS